MECMLKLDGNLHAELNADIQKELNLELNRAKTSQKEKKDNDVVKVMIHFSEAISNLTLAVESSVLLFDVI